MREKNALTKWTFDFDKKFKIFKRGLSHSVFFVHSNFEIRFFFCSKLGNCADCPNSRKLTFAQILTKSQNFQGGLVLHNFSCRFRFWGLFLHSTIQNCSNRCDSTAIGFNVNFDQESRCSSKACSIQIFI